MNKKLLIPVAVLLITAISFYSNIDTKIKDKKEYEKILSNAREYASQGIVDDAVKYYKSAIELNCDVKTYLEYVNVYVDNGYEKKALRVAEDMVDALNDAPEAYECLLDRYIGLKSFEDCFKLDDEVTKRKLRSESFAQKMAEIEYYYDKDYQSYQSVNTFSGGYAAVQSDELYGFIDETGKRILNKTYENAGCFSYYTNTKNKDDSGYVVPVCKDGVWMYVSSSGNKKIEIDKSLKFDHLGLYVDGGLIAASIKGTYSYYNTDFKKQFGDYMYATAFNCGVAAVQVKASEWYIINEKGEKLNSTPYLDVVLDGKEIAFRNNRAFVMLDGNYCMIDTECNVIGSGRYLKAKPFIDNVAQDSKSKDDKIALAAVNIDGKWGFVDVNGDVVIKPQFNDAHSFANSFAAVNKSGKWGFIDSTGNVVIDCTFEDVGDFNTKGCVFTLSNKRWNLIKLYRFNH